ncbi:MAG: hypothetical protein GY715_21955, partial [Planctomycetes bacterium]|nr:hypothetical protein [Planctomycetota bacterium]
MFGTAELTDDVVRSAADGSPPALARVADALSPQVRLMVAARLLPTPAQFHAAEDICQQVMTALARGLDRLEHRTVGGLKAYVSGMVRHQVAEALRRWQREGGKGRRVRSLESNVGTALHSSPLWQHLSGSVISPRSEVDRAEQTERLLLELGRLKDSY